MKSDLELARVHVEALFAHDDLGRMVSVNEPNGAPAPRFFLGRVSEGNEWRFRYDVRPELVDALVGLCLKEPVGHFVWESSGSSEEYVDLLKRDGPVRNVWAGPAFRFPSLESPDPRAVPVSASNVGVLHAHFAGWIDDVGADLPFWARVLDGNAVSICTSVRVTGEAHEAGVETAVEYRGRGFASEVVSAWASAVIQVGRIPLYSTSWDNKASRAVARKLGLVQFAADLHIT